MGLEGWNTVKDCTGSVTEEKGEIIPQFLMAQRNCQELANHGINFTYTTNEEGTTDANGNTNLGRNSAGMFNSTEFNGHN